MEMESGEPPRASVLLVSGDLMLVSTADGLVRQRGWRLATAGTGNAVEACRELQPAIIVLDLRAPGMDPKILAPSLRDAADGAVILACGPHVHEAALAAAAEAGCDEVVTRGQFEMRLRAALERLDGSAG